MDEAEREEVEEEESSEGNYLHSEVVQSQILSSFLDGKSTSTYFHVLLCNNSLQSSAFHLIRDALVDRYLNLAKSEHFAKHNDEVRDVLDIIREDIRTCTENRRAAIDIVGQIDTSSDDGFYSQCYLCV